MNKSILQKIEPKDIIAFLVLSACLYMIYCGINHLVSGITIMIVTYYFRKKMEDIGFHKSK